MARFRCRACGRSFSAASDSPCFGQKRRRLNWPVYKLSVSGCNIRRIAKILGTNPKTVVRKRQFMSKLAEERHARFIVSIEASGSKIKLMQFDEMETFEHSKCKPLSIAVAVETTKRKILGLTVSSMPARGPLAEIARRKYGDRPDERREGAREMFRRISGVVDERALVKTDKNPKYPSWISSCFPNVRHVALKGRRPSAIGFGELRSYGFDPLFSLNHTCAMIRANVNRLFRRTWCTTKRRDRLLSHLMLYVDYHNRFLTKAL